jgi:GNAT superfamily N-acetyltransferase
MPQPPPSHASTKRVTEAQVGAVTDLFARAFYDDPTWSWAFPDPAKRLENYRRMWGLIIHTAVPYGSVWTTSDGGAAAVWIPPGRPELTPEAEAKVEPLLREALGSHADDVLELMERFGANHPHHPPHYYLSLLGTHPEHRGKGKGMALLSQTLAEIDKEGMPAYLESSNPNNNARYENVGFVQVGEFAAPGDGPTVTRMWRDRQ